MSRGFPVFFALLAVVVAACGCGGGASAPPTPPNPNPVPTIAALAPPSATAGGTAFTLTVNGGNFVAGSVVRWNGSNRPTAFVSSSQLTAQIPAGDIAAASTAQVTVFNPAPGGGRSNPQTFTVNAAGGSGFSLRFHGNGVNDIDRVKILIHNTPPMPDPPANVGATDFTLEFWMKAIAAENPAVAVQCGGGGNINWINGNIIFDRDRFNQGQKFGLSVAGGRFIFGVSGAITVPAAGADDTTICGVTNVLDGVWHHVAAERRLSDGQMWLFLDGRLDAQGTGPLGDISYPVNGVPCPNCCPGGQPCTNSDPYLVIGAEKHDAGSQFPSFSGWVTEVRLSTTLRYLANFTPAAQRFGTDPNTAALYHFGEGQGDIINDSSNASGGPSPGVRKFGPTPPIPPRPAGPEWSTDTPPFQ